MWYSRHAGRAVVSPELCIHPLEGLLGMHCAVPLLVVRSARRQCDFGVVLSMLMLRLPDLSLRLPLLRRPACRRVLRRRRSPAPSSPSPCASQRRRRRSGCPRQLLAHLPYRGSGVISAQALCQSSCPRCGVQRAWQPSALQSPNAKPVGCRCTLVVGPAPQVAAVAAISVRASADTVYTRGL